MALGADDAIVQIKKEPGKGLRLIFDYSSLIALAGLLVGGGMAWQRFLDDGNRLEQHDQEIAQLTQIAQTTSQNLAVLNQKVEDIRVSVSQTPQN